MSESPAGGAARGSVAGEDELVVRRPGDGSEVARVPVVDADGVQRMVARAREAQARWGALHPRVRARRLRALRKAIVGRSEELVETIRAETGKPPTEALSELVVVVDLLRHYERRAPRALAPRRAGTGWMAWKRGYVVRDPYGVVAVISPWNYPFILAMESVATALFCGNAVVLKPSEATPLTGLEAERLARDAGLPEGLVQVAPGGGETGAALIAAGADRIVFTGSVATGRRVMAAAAETLTPVTLELGGKDAAIVLDDADLERTARGLVFGAFYNAGQTCISVERAYVVEELYEPLIDRMSELAAGLRLGDGGDDAGEVDIGPMTLPSQLGIVEEHVRDAVKRGARVVAGGERAAPGSAVYRPTILADVDASMRIMREETFGPVLPVVPVTDADDALARANASRFGLAGSVWTRDRKRGEAVARRLRAGGVVVNDALLHYAVPSLPMGGVGESGFGRTRGLEGLLEMSVPRSILVDRAGLRREPWWFPYDRFGHRLLAATLEIRGRGLLRGLLPALRRLAGRGPGDGPGGGREGGRP